MMINNALHTTKANKEKIKKAKEWVHANIPDVRSFVLTNGSVKNNQLLPSIVIAVVVLDSNRSNTNKILRKYNRTQSFVRMYAVTESQVDYDEDLQGGVVL